jgi:hypothetical protein
MLDRSISQYQPKTKPVLPNPSLVIGGEIPPQHLAPSLNSPQASINQAAHAYSTPTTANHVLGSPKLVSRTLPSKTLTPSPESVPQRIVNEIRETTLVDLKTLNQSRSMVSFKKTVIIGVSLFFLGIFLAMIVMFLIF